LLLTPTPDATQASTYEGEDKSLLGAHAEQIRALADAYGVGWVDSLLSQRAADGTAVLPPGGRSESLEYP
jgi:hypothetical protein